LMQKKQNGPITDAEIKKVSESTTDLFIWKYKLKKPLIRTTIFDLDKVSQTA
jgi:hypothetical protein